MNIIEQLGGYEKASEDFKKLHLNLKEQQKSNKVFIDAFDALKNELLEYRRQHNIFEVGDIAVNSRGDESRLLKIWRVDICPADKRMSIADYDADGLAGWSRFHCLRHAEPEELKAGKRL